MLTAGWNPHGGRGCLGGLVGRESLNDGGRNVVH